MIYYKDNIFILFQIIIYIKKLMSTKDFNRSKKRAKSTSTKKRKIKTAIQKNGINSAEEINFVNLINSKEFLTKDFRYKNDFYLYNINSSLVNYDIKLIMMISEINKLLSTKSKKIIKINRESELFE